MAERGQFTFYRSYWDAIGELPAKQQLPVLEAIILYSLYGITPPLNQRCLNIFKQLKPEMDREVRESKEGRRSSEYKAWRAAVFERDNYTCQICNIRGIRLNAHHIKSYAHHHDLRYVVSNGVTLCERCHKLVHRIMRGGGTIGLD